MAAGERMTEVEETEVEEIGDILMPSGNEISIAWGDVQIMVRSDQSLDDIEDRVFRVLKRLKESLNCGKQHDPAMG